VDYEHITGATGIRFYEAGLGANVVSYARGGWLRLEGGYRYSDPRASSVPNQKGPFVRLGLVFDRGKGSVPPSRRWPTACAELLRAAARDTLSRRSRRLSARRGHAVLSAGPCTARRAGLWARLQRDRLPPMNRCFRCVPSSRMSPS
jgi:hypothetical protein